MPTYESLAVEARSRLSPEAYDYIATGAGIEETLQSNESAWRERLLRPRVLRDVSAIDTSISLLGTRIAAPIGIAPTGYQRAAHPEGETAMARGAAEAGSLFVLSTRATATFAEVAAVAGPWWFQVYLMVDRGLTERLVRAAVEAGARALVLTVDTPYVGTKARPAGPPVPDGAGALLPELAEREDPGVYQDPNLSYADIPWLQGISGLPVIVKGVLRGDDAAACVEAGAAAVWVSNHGGRQLDGVLPTAHALPEVVEAVGSRRTAEGDPVEVYVDGGVRTGRDVLRALALGARAAFVGRPASWALVTGGAVGVAGLLTGLADEVEEALALAGCRSVDEVTRDLVAP